MEKMNWAIIGLGSIAEQTMQSLSKCKNAVLYACASRSLEKASEFAKKFGFQKAYGSYEEVFADPNVQVVYITTPHHLHAKLAKMALQAGKPVVSEKPATVNQIELLELIELSKKTNTFFMEAMWTKFLPAWSFVLDFIKSGKLGKIKAFYADFCIDVPCVPGSRLYEPSLAGGALLDVGIYPLTTAFMVASSIQNCAFSDVKINSIHSVCRKSVTGVDAFNSISVDFGDFVGVLTSAVDAGCSDRFITAKIIGENGVLHIPEFSFTQTVNFIGKDGKLLERFDFPFAVNGYEYEFEAAMEAINNGKIEVEQHSHKDSLLLIKTMDSLRKEWGIVYPFENSKKVEPINQTKKITIYTDGACSGNPGPGGFGSVILVDDKEIPISGGEKRTTNNRMELMAPIKALETVLADSTLAKLPITLITDSQYVKSGIQSWIHSWKQNGWRTASKEPVKNKDLWLALDGLCNSLNVEWKWIKGHAGNKYNELCDNLAVEAAKRSAEN